MAYLLLTVQVRVIYRLRFCMGFYKNILSVNLTKAVQKLQE